jgi:hypothetical protein
MMSRLSISSSVEAFVREAKMWAVLVDMSMIWADGKFSVTFYIFFSPSHCLIRRNVHFHRHTHCISMRALP